MNLTIPTNYEKRLKDLGVLDKFITNVKEYDRIYSKYFPGGRIINEESFLTFVSTAFVWEAFEGYEFWINIATDEN